MSVIAALTASACDVMRHRTAISVYTVTALELAIHASSTADPIRKQTDFASQQNTNMSPREHRKSHSDLWKPSLQLGFGGRDEAKTWQVEDIHEFLCRRHHNCWRSSSSSSSGKVIHTEVRFGSGLMRAKPIWTFQRRTTPIPRPLPVSQRA